MLIRRQFLSVAASGVVAAALAPRLGFAQQLTEDEVFHDPDAPVLGNPQGDVTIVEFFDYQCPFCRKLAPDLARLIQEDTNVRLVLRDWPILSATSKVAARAALAAGYQDKYPQAHAALFAVAGRLDQSKVDEALKTAGIDL